ERAIDAPVEAVDEPVQVGEAAGRREPLADRREPGEAEPLRERGNAGGVERGTGALDRDGLPRARRSDPRERVLAAGMGGVHAVGIERAARQLERQVAGQVRRHAGLELGLLGLRIERTLLLDGLLAGEQALGVLAARVARADGGNAAL